MNMMTQQLDEIASEIHEEANSIVEQISKSRVKIGELLLEARDFFDGDKEFGQWRQEKLPFLKQRETSKLIGYAKLVKERPVLEELPESTAFVLLSAPDGMLDKVEERVENGDKPSRREMEKEVYKPKATTPPPPPKETTPPPAAQPQSISTCQKVINMVTGRRIENLHTNRDQLDEVEMSYMMFGLDPQPQCAPNAGTIKHLYAALLEDDGMDQELADLLEQAKKVIDKDRSQFK